MALLVLHMFFPALPAVKASLGASEFQVGLTTSIPLFTMAVFTLAYGSLSDRYGRRPVLLTGLLLFVFGSEVSALAETIWTLIAGRFLQAAGAACGLALARAIARDVYGSDRLVKVLAYLLMAYAMGPMVAPPIIVPVVSCFSCAVDTGIEKTHSSNEVTVNLRSRFMVHLRMGVLRLEK